ncbi:MAG: LicD family protein [Lachnospiraceae bacterium]|nr:LicD family protein [Lachnospiraceae bacterium]
MGIKDSFLLDEVRCGFLVPSAIKQAWAAQLEVLAEIDRVCKKHNIQYFADWGTLLGTVRHGGYIPWDDDLDIVMKRADYERFMTVARFDMEEGFDVQTFRNQKDYWLFMGKVVGKNHFCFEKEHLRRFHNFPYIACVDIFVLDYVYRDLKQEEERRTLCKYMLGVADAIVEGRLQGIEKEKRLCTVEEMYDRKLERFSDPVEMGRYLYGEIEKIFARVPEMEADTLTQLFPWGLKGNGLHFPKEYYAEAIYLPFEHTTMPVPAVYDRMLRQRYGDYMKVVRDAGAHNYPFFEGQKVNLQKVLDFPLPAFTFDSAILKRSEGELACKGMSYKILAKECSNELKQMKEQIIEAIQLLLQGEDATQELVEEVLNLLQMSQHLAVDLGTLLEQVKGEGCAIVSVLEKYCETVYLLYEALVAGGGESVISGCENMIEMQQQIDIQLETQVLQRKAVLFLPVFSGDWNGMQSLWQAAKEDKQYDVYVVPLPYYFKDYDGSPKEILCDLETYPEEVCGLDYRQLTQEYLELLHPDVIILQTPYDGWNPVWAVPKQYHAEQIRRYTEQLVYVPPFSVEDYTEENGRAYSNMNYYVTMPGVVYADRVLVQSENMRVQYVEKLTEFAGEDTRGCWQEKIVANRELYTELHEDARTAGEAQLSKQRQISESRKKKILYGISLGTTLENPEAAKAKQERSQQIFEEYKEQIELKVYHFPEEGKKYRADEFDAYYGDPMPIVIEFQQLGKPVMLQNINL